MDRWHSQWTWAREGPSSENQKNALPALEESTASYINDINTLDSPSVSKDDSIESYAEDHFEKSDTNITKPTFKSIQQAKKRLQAFSAAKQLKRHPSKDEKTEDADKSDKMSSKKSKKALYPLDKAQAVVQEIEEIKQKEAEEAQEEKRKIDAIMSIAYKNIALRARSRSRSPSPERDNQFRKREIKSRNYRRSDSFKRRSLSPENYGKRSGKLVYPENWIEYKQQGLTLVKDEELKSKVFPKSKLNTNELVAKFLSFDGPSPIMDPFKVLSLEEKLENIPFSLLRITRSKPTITYSINNRKCKDSFLTRKQLFHVISRDRRTIIEKLINSASSKSSQFEMRTVTSRPWYSRSWKRSADAECKILENSVGLSFLQTYSDEEEENETEEVIINNANDFEQSDNVTISWEQKQEVELCITNHIDSVEDRDEIEEERDTLTPEEKPDMVLRKQNEENIEETKKYRKGENDKKHQKEEDGEEVTPERVSSHQKEEVVKKKDKEELNETRKAIRELEEELERRKALREEEEEQKEVRKVKKKKKKAKKKEVSSDSEEEEKPKKKKKKKVKSKKKYSEEDEDSDSSDSDRSKKSKKKSKRKKEKIKKKKEKSKKVDTSGREHKAKKRDEEGENDNKKKKKCDEDDFDIDHVEEDKRNQKKSKEKDKDRSSEGESEIKKKKSSKKEKDNKKSKTRSRHNSSDFTEDKDNVFEEYRKQDDPMLTNSFEECEVPFEPPQKLDKERRNDTSSERERRQKEVRKSKHDSERSARSDDSTRRKEKEFDLMYDDVKVNEKSRDKYKFREEVKHKVEIELEKPYGKQSERRTSRSSEKFSKEDPMIKREDSKAKSQKQRDYNKPICVKTEPDWENLRSKRDRHRYSDYKESPDRISNDFGHFPLEKDIYLTKDKDARKREIGTPDTEEYRENWEKESDPIWESEEEAPTKARGKLNNSWESDEEIFERGHQAMESVRPISDVFDLEIPLNIKPFKRREIIDPDTELQLLKKQSLSLDEERRRFEIEKQRVKELQMKVIKEAKEDKKPKRRRSKERDVIQMENTSKKWESNKKDRFEKEELTPKRGRWDKKMSSPKLPCPKLNIIDISQIKKEIIDDDSSTNVSSTTSVNTSAVLENEYEEFMKALTTSPKKPLEKTKAKEDKIILDDSSRSSKLDKISTPKPVKLPDTIEISPESQMSIPLPPTPQIVTILPKDIPLIPMPLPKEMKPMPVPSPQIEVDKIPKPPLINLSLSANITLDIAPKFTTPPVDSPNTSVTTPSTAAQTIEKQKEEEVVNIPAPVALSGTENTESADKSQPNKPFMFTSMVLASKRPLLNNSNLNLGDSDDEDKPSKSLKKLEDIVKENNLEDVPELPVEQPEELEVKKEKPEVREGEKKVERVEARSKSPERESRRKRSPERQSRRTSSPRRSYGSKRDASPRRRGRESPHRRRGHSPKRHSPRRRLSPKRRSPAKRRHSPRRSPSPKTRRRGSVSPRRRSPRRSPSPKYRAASPKKFKSKPPEAHSSSYKPPLDRPVSTSGRSKSPTANTSPLEGLKRSVADSTISDDLLPQPSLTVEEYTQSPVTQFYEKTAKGLDSPKREPLDVRINQALGIAQQPKEQPRHIPTIYSNYGYEAARFTQQYDKTTVEAKSNVIAVQQSFNVVAVQQSKSNFVQVGNMVQILPTEDIPTPVHVEKAPVQRKAGVAASVAPGVSRPAVKNEKKSQIVQVGNMLQIVPADLPPAPPLPPEPKTEAPEPPTTSIPVTVAPAPSPEKQSAETAMRLKVAERREEREKRRQERERRRREKEKRRRDKERQRQIKLKQRTENMIKRALELEAEGLEGSPESVFNETPAQWPPLSLSVAVSTFKEAGKSILVRAGSRGDSPRRKVVQFADGVRPGEGTSPSGGEELSSPPPRKKLPKEKRYKKTKLHKKNQKKKVKVKVIKKRSEPDESDDDDCSEADDLLPPPSPPPGSPPPHVFPPRVKPQAINALQPYLAGIVPIAGAQQQQQQLFRPQQQQIGIVMHPHHHHPPHHHGPPPPPPHHHHGPPPPPPHHHHGPPHFHPGPPPPPPHHHGPPPPPGPPHHHHHGPPPPFHH